MELTLIGCGAQAKYVRDICLRKDITITKVLDPIGKREGAYFCGIPIYKFQEKEIGEDNVAICISDLQLKAEIYHALQDRCNFPKFIHPEAFVYDENSIGEGCIINPKATIMPDSRIGICTLIHAGVDIEHDCIVGSFSIVSPHAVLLGWSQIGSFTKIYSNATISPVISIGDHCIVGANSFVKKNIPSYSSCWGIPAELTR